MTPKKAVYFPSILYVKSINFFFFKLYCFMSDTVIVICYLSEKEQSRIEVLTIVHKMSYYLPSSLSKQINKSQVGYF